MIGLLGPVLGHGDQVGGVRRLDAVDALEDVPADHHRQEDADDAQDLGRVLAHLLQGGARRRLQRHGRIGIFLLESLDRVQLVQAQGAGVGAHIAHGEDPRRQDGVLALLQRGQETRMHPRLGRQFGHGQARRQARGAQRGAQGIVRGLLRRRFGRRLRGLIQRRVGVEVERGLPILVHRVGVPSRQAPVRPSSPLRRGEKRGQRGKAAPLVQTSTLSLRARDSISPRTDPADEPSRTFIPRRAAFRSADRIMRLTGPTPPAGADRRL